MRPLLFPVPGCRPPLAAPGGSGGTGKTCWCSWRSHEGSRGVAEASRAAVTASRAVTGTLRLAKGWGHVSSRLDASHIPQREPRPLEFPARLCLPRE